jgi:hypothetical protein
MILKTFVLNVFMLIPIFSGEIYNPSKKGHSPKAVRGHSPKAVLSVTKM